MSFTLRFFAILQADYNRFEFFCIGFQSSDIIVEFKQLDIIRVTLLDLLERRWVRHCTKLMRDRGVIRFAVRRSRTIR